MKLKLVPETDPVLREISLPVTKFDGRLRDLATALSKLMHEKGGVGIHAVQVGKPIQLMIIGSKINALAKTETVMVNPKIVKTRGAQIFKEGCLTFPGRFIPVKRPRAVHIEYQDLKGNKHSVIVEGLAAVIVCHEFEHGLGRLITDYDRIMSLTDFDKELQSVAKPLVVNSAPKVLDRPDALTAAQEEKLTKDLNELLS